MAQLSNLSEQSGEARQEAETRITQQKRMIEEAEKLRKEQLTFAERRTAGI